MNSNDITNHNLVASMSKITDTDYGKTTIDYSIKNALNQYSFIANQANMQQNAVLAQV